MNLRATHDTILLDKGVPVHVVAKRCGHDAAMLLKVYAKRTKKADANAAGVIGTLTQGSWVKIGSNRSDSLRMFLENH
jgi:integrase